MRRTLFLCLTLTTLQAARAQTVFHSLPEVLTAALRDNPTQRIYRLKTGQLTAGPIEKVRLS